MDELIKVTYANDRPTISGRELHEFLEVETPYKKWFERMCEYGFDEEISYWTFLSNRSDGKAGKPRTDHQLTIEMAKEICMLQRSEKGKQARTYFINLEKQWNSPEAVMARALKLANSKIEDLSKIIGSQKEEIEEKDKTIEHKQGVIAGLVEDITLADKRQILNRVVRHNHANYKDRWAVLYREFENKYHINLQLRCDKYNEHHSPKCKSRLDYIDKVMNKLSELYDMAAKIYENDVRALVNEMYAAAG